MKSNCTKAIIAVGGFGTRWLPITKAIEKYMLPVGNRPVIDYVVEDCVKAGIKDIYFVVSEQSDQLRRYYGENEVLQRYLWQRGKTKELEQLKLISIQANFHYIVQKSNLPYGTAVPIMLCERYIDPNEQVVVLMGDQFIWDKDHRSHVARLLGEVRASGVTAGMMVTSVPRGEVHKYGIVEVSWHQHKRYFRRIVEKPSAKEAPSTLTNLSMYIFDRDMFHCIQHITPTNGEYYVTDALNIYAEQLGKQLTVVTAKGEYLDCGTVDGWLRANQYVARYA